MQILTWSVTLRHEAEAGASAAAVHMAARPSMRRGGENRRLAAHCGSKRPLLLLRWCSNFGTHTG